jgi:hypothetical protein
MFDNGALKRTYSSLYTGGVFPTVPPTTVIGALSGFAFGNISIKNIQFLGGFDEPTGEPHHYDGQLGSFFQCVNVESIDEWPDKEPIFNYIELGYPSPEEEDRTYIIGRAAFHGCEGMKYFSIPS